VNVRLIPRAQSALDGLLSDSKLNVTDLINRAVLAYAHFWEFEKEGAEVVVNRSDGTAERIKMI